MYGEVNEVLNEVIFSGRFESRPVFMVLDSVALASAAKRLGQREEEVETFICKEVGRSLSRTGDPYARHATQLKFWCKEGMASKPPFTALLFCLSHAAELMASDGQHTQGNYYVRLSELTGLPREQLSLHGIETEKFWHWLARWLASTDYRFGRPTARPVNQFKYVSIAISQAIIRAGDRACFHDMFERYGFAGGYNVTEAEIWRYIDSWIRSSAANHRLRQAWADPKLRPRICEIVIAELDDWSEASGASSGGDREQLATLALALSLVPGFPDRVAALSLGLHGEQGDVQLLSDQQGRELTLDNDVFGSFATLSPPALVPLPEIMLKGAEYAAVAQNRTFRWRYKAVIPFVRAESGPFWIETNKTAIGSQHVVLVRDRQRTRSAVEDLLAELAAPGFTLATSSDLPGLPVGWVLYEHVRLERMPTELPDNDLRSLVPIAKSAGLVTAGGLRLSRSVWHRHAPPVMRFEGSRGPTRIELFEGIDTEGPALANAESEGEACELDISSFVPASGDMVALAHEAGKEAGYHGFLCRTARRPRPLEIDALQGLQYASPFSAVSRAELADEDRAENWVNASGELPSFLPEGFAVLAAGGEAERGFSAPLLASLEPLKHGKSVDTKSILAMSCGERGSHYWICETVPQGGKPDMPLNMECRDCGLSVLTKNRGKAPKQAQEKARDPVPRASGTAEPVEQVDQDLLLDALCFLGEGSWASLEALLSINVSEPWQAYAVARSLEALGYVDLVRKPGTGRIARWSIASPSLFLFTEGRAYLRGFRNITMLDAARELLLAGGALDISESLEGQPRNIAFDSVEPGIAVRLAESVKDPHGRSIALVIDPPRAFARRLQGLGGIKGMLVPFSVADDVASERYDLVHGRWNRCDDVQEPGAYRLAWRGQAYAYRDKKGGLFQGPHEIVKLLAARDAGINLHAFSQASSEFISRLGAEPTGLLARALCACSGHLPIQDAGVVKYPNVPSDVAAAILNTLYPPEVPNESS
ncbi:hypothetical protein [Novosphingobium sp.]|uniref:hypothetical protein n=1 Tax=Novosphingobium sp. TaxID=1874826 RepID=UPI001D71D263|nr:hypothetical protein [Novosphingobium sp.]MBX9663726.1 hypothetical protein [Novosphingobium sp.]